MRLIIVYIYFFLNRMLGDFLSDDYWRHRDGTGWKQSSAEAGDRGRRIPPDAHIRESPAFDGTE